MIGSKNYAEEEKEILLDHFVVNRPGHARRFNEYTNNFLMEKYKQGYNIKEIPSAVQKDFDKAIKMKNLIRIVGFPKYDTIDKLWDNEKGDNLVTYFLSHKKFSYSNTALKQLNYFHPNWNHQNKEGKSALFFLVEELNGRKIKEIIDSFGCNPNLQDNKGHYFTWYMFDENRFNILDMKNKPSDVMSKMSYQLEVLESILTTYAEHFKFSPKKALQFDEMASRMIHKIENYMRDVDIDVGLRQRAEYFINPLLDKFKNSVMAVTLSQSVKLPNDNKVKLKV